MGTPQAAAAAPVVYQNSTFSPDAHDALDELGGVRQAGQHGGRLLGVVDRDQPGHPDRRPARY
jgi:hypothetical protein